MMRPALTFADTSAAYAVMVRICQATTLRCFFAALIACALLLNGMGAAALANHGAAGNKFVVIAGTHVTLCQFGGGDDKGGPLVLHGCDQCGLCASPALPTVPQDRGVERPARTVILRPAAILAAVHPAPWRVSWPRGPPFA